MRSYAKSRSPVLLGHQVRMREEEIQSLQEALKILSGEDI